MHRLHVVVFSIIIDVMIRPGVGLQNADHSSVNHVHASRLPVSSAHASQPHASQLGASQRPINQSPADLLAAGRRPANQPHADQFAAGRRPANQSHADQFAAGRRPANPFHADQLAAGRRPVNQSHADPLAAGRPPVNQSHADLLTGGRRPINQTQANQIAAGPGAAGQPPSNRPFASQPVISRPTSASQPRHGTDTLIDMSWDHFDPYNASLELGLPQPQNPYHPPQFGENSLTGMPARPSPNPRQDTRPPQDGKSPGKSVSFWLANDESNASRHENMSSTPAGILYSGGHYYTASSAHQHAAGPPMYDPDITSPGILNGVGRDHSTESVDPNAVNPPYHDPGVDDHSRGPYVTDAERNPPIPDHPADRYRAEINAILDAQRKVDFTALTMKRCIAERQIDEAAEYMELLKQAFSEFESLHHQLMDHYLSTNVDESHVYDAERYFTEQLNNYVSIVDSANDRINCYDSVRNGSMHNNLSLGSNASDILKIVHSIKAPQVELDTFDGSDPKQFHPFMKKFDLAMQGCDDYKYMVQILLQLCKKDAGRDLGPILFISDSKKAFEEGRRILFEKYGDHSEISYDIVESLRSRKKCVTAKDLKLFSSELNTAYRTLQELQMMSRMISDSIIRDLVLKLPHHLCVQYQKRALKFKKASSFYPDFQFFCEFVQECSDQANDKIFGQEFLDQAKSAQPFSSSPSSMPSQVKPKPRFSSASVSATDLSVHDQVAPPGGQKDLQSYSTSGNNSSSDQNWPCPVCKNGTRHKLWACERFKSMDVQKRFELVRKENLCYFCLTPGHSAVKCLKTNTCRVDGCGKRHSVWIHGASHGSNLNPASSTNQVKSMSNQNTSVVHMPTTESEGTDALIEPANQSSPDTPPQEQILNETSAGNLCTGGVVSPQSQNQDLRVHMPIVKAIVADNQVINVALDTFSSNTFCSKRLVSAANLPIFRNPGSLTVGTMTGNERYEGAAYTQFSIQSMDRETSVNLSGVYVWDKIPVKCNHLDISEYDHLRDLDLVTGEITEVDLLIGQDFSQCLLPLHTFKNENNLEEPFAILTILGTCLNGTTKKSMNQISSKLISTHITALKTNVSMSPSSFDQIEHDISRLYEIESPIKIRSWSQDDLRVVQLWENEHIRIGSKYQVPIPLKDPEEPVPNNYPVVKSMTESLAKRLKRKGSFEKYDKKMNSLIDDGYVEIIPPEPYSNPNKTNYIPHHDVYHPRKPDPRIVHNAKFKYKGFSLNDKCLQGPNFLSRADSVLTRFRLHRYAFQGDIKAMYFQVIIPPEQRDLLRFLWYDGEGNLIHLRHTRHIFGGVWCSSSSQFVLRKAIEREENPVVRNAVLDGFYVDDCLTSVDEKSHLVVLVKELPGTLDQHGYEVTKILVNDPEVLEMVPPERRAEEVRDLTPADHDEIHTYALGIRWEVRSDMFYFVFEARNYGNLTRRVVLSVASGVYDPLGLISPLTIYGRILFQECNRQKLGWDQTLPASLTTKWEDWIERLRRVEELRIPRCVKNVPTSDCTLELHTFADASSEAYCAVSYLRVETAQDITSTMYRSKTRVAPIKQISIPRLELQACLMACQLTAMVREDLTGISFTSHYWSDSKIALAYIMNDSKKFAPFVANRLTDINKLSAKAEWHYVSTNDNPADLGTRGKVLSHDELNPLWFTGPSWLAKPKSEWPIYQNESPDLNEYELELECRGSCMSTTVSNSLIDRIFDYYSKYGSMRRAAAYLLRFVDYVRTQQVMKGPLSYAEVCDGKRLLIRHAQSSSFEKEITDLSVRGYVNKSSCVANLSPFLDRHGILRVGGRTGADPILLQGSSKLSQAIILQAHEIAHTGTEWTLGLVRREFWLTKGRASVKSVISPCMTCKRLFSQPQEQFMAPLPPERISPGLPVFSYVGIDCFGPYLVRNYRSDIKRNVCLFTCLASRAIHLEVLCSMETSAMINALRRFIARRGAPIKAFSDQGTNLTGAYGELKASWSHIPKEELQSYATNSAGFEWIFISPKSPWKGGAWERLVGVSKHVAQGIRGVLNQNTRLNDEVLSTLFCEVENMVNNRPLTKVNDDVNDYSYISPNHLLIGRAGSDIPPGKFSPDDVYRKAWRHAQNLATRFWKIWVRLYLPELQKRQKWLSKRDNMKEGDLVLLLDESCPRGLWPLAVVSKVKCGRDDLVRSIELKSRTSKPLTRPVNKTVLLEAKTPDMFPQKLKFTNIYD